MCGIAGLFVSAGGSSEALAATASAMGAALNRRGPDGAGVWADPECPLALAHRRLSIIDLSSAGAQPMTSADGRFVLSYNGEVYNFRALRADLERAGHRFRGASDTEVMLECFAALGVERTLEGVDGMFALALWDRRTQRLVLARDRMGEKPLYYGWWEGQFLFASELNAFAAVDGFAPAIDRDALALYLRHNYVPEPYCIYTGLRKLEPGSWLELDTRSDRQNPEPRRYWSLRGQIETAQDATVRYSDAEAVERLDELLSRAVTSRMVSDVPLGALLSGGIDSSTVVALMQAGSTTPVRTFSVGFDIAGYDEAGYARAVAGHLGTDHTELYVGADDARAVIPELADVYSEPFADVSQIPTLIVARLARQHVTVAMTGDGGDELFAGYLRYTAALTTWQRFGVAPAALRAVAARAIVALGPRSWDRVFGLLNRCLPRQRRYRTAGDKLHKLARILDTTDPLQMYFQLISMWPEPAQIVRGANASPAACSMPDTAWAGDDWVTRMMYLDALHYLPGDILTKVDRAAMSAGLETRVPLLSPEVIAFAWQLPIEQKVRHGEGKWILRRVLERYLPADLFERPKMGFGVPLDSWLRGPLRPWAEDLLSTSRLQRGGYFEPAPVRAAWQAHLSGARNLQYPLWGVLMFEAWRERWSGQA